VTLSYITGCKRCNFITFLIGPFGKVKKPLDSAAASIATLWFVPIHGLIQGVSQLSPTRLLSVPMAWSMVEPSTGGSGKIQVRLAFAPDQSRFTAGTRLGRSAGSPPRRRNGGKWNRVAPRELDRFAFIKIPAHCDLR
jgi:hypothetical protein